MITDLHNALGKLLHEQGKIPAEVDVRFDAAIKEWTSSLTRPTINLFLFSVQENTEKRETNMETTRGNGIANKRMRPRRIDLHYMVSVLTTDVQDEHELLWRVLATLLKHQDLPEDVIPESLKNVEPRITTRMADEKEASRFLDIWSALETPPHAALHYVVTAPLDLNIAIQAPLVLTRTARYLSGLHSGALIDTKVHIGGTIRDNDGRPLADVTVELENAVGGSKTDQEGHFVLPGVPNGPITLNVIRTGKTRKQVKASVPQESYDIVLDE